MWSVNFNSGKNLSTKCENTSIECLLNLDKLIYN